MESLYKSDKNKNACQTERLLGRKSLIVQKWCKQTQLAKNNWCLQKSGKGKMMSRGLMTTLNGTPTEVEGTVWSHQHSLSG